LAVSKRAKTVQTIRNYLSAVRTLSKLYGLQCPTPTTDGGLGLTVRGLAKKLGKNKRRMFPLTKHILKRLKIESLNLYPSKYKFHAFRRGGMHTGSKVVRNLELLRLHGGWQSEAWKVYMDLPAESRLEVSEAILTFLSD
jgi:hypothetical protein